MDFADILKIHGYDPKEVRLARHAGYKEKIYLLWRNKPDEYEIYCRTQQVEAFGQQKYVAHFIATPEGGTLFTGFYILGKKKPVKPGMMHPITGSNIYITESPRPIIYDVTRVIQFDHYAGKLFIAWGAGTRSWSQIASKTSKRVLEIRRELAEPEFPGFSKFSCLSTEVNVLPETWKCILTVSRGIYILVHLDTQTQYIGSATGAGGFLGRWLSYEANGHGGNALLRKLSNKQFQIGILEVSSSIETSAEIIRREQEWKQKLGSKAFGLNFN